MKYLIKVPTLNNQFPRNPPSVYYSFTGGSMVAQAPNTVHPNCLNACDTPAYFSGLPHGTYARKDFSTLVAGDQVVVVFVS